MCFRLRVFFPGVGFSDCGFFFDSRVVDCGFSGVGFSDWVFSWQLGVQTDFVSRLRIFLVVGFSEFLFLFFVGVRVSVSLFFLLVVCDGFLGLGRVFHMGFVCLSHSWFMVPQVAVL